MKKKVVTLILLCSCLLMGCEEEPMPSMVTVSMEYSDFSLVTDSKTGIVYLDNCIRTGADDNFKFTDRWHIYTPYYGRNGKPCKFVDGKVVEVE